MNPADELQIQYEIHSSIDFVEEKLKTSKKDMRELYLGQLYSTEDHKVYPLFQLYYLFILLNILILLMLFSTLFYCNIFIIVDEV